MTQRTYSELITQFPDNTTGLITPADMRDFIDSVEVPHGRVSLATPVETDITQIGLYTKVNGIFVAGPYSHLTTPDTTGRITYIGPSQRHFHLVTSVSMTCAGNNQTVSFRMAVNGTTDASTQLRRRIGTGTDIGSTALHGDELLTTNDYVELYVANLTSTANITIQDCYFFMVGMF